MSGEERTGRVLKTRAPAPPTPVGTTPDSPTHTDEVLTREEVEILRLLLRKVTDYHHIKWASDLGFGLYNLGYTSGVIKR